MTEYIPGVCNIGYAEIQGRRRVGLIGIGVSFLLFVSFMLFHIPVIYRIIIFFPLISAAAGFLQAYFHFCAGFGFRGVYNVLKPIGQTETIEQQEFRKKDKQKALKITIMACTIGIILTIIIYLLPF